jgi:hypothetical protein
LTCDTTDLALTVFTFGVEMKHRSGFDLRSSKCSSSPPRSRAYHKQVTKACGTSINEHEQLKSAATFTAGEIRRHLDFDCDRHCGMLCRRGIRDAEEYEGYGLRCGKSWQAWRPVASFLNSGPVGFTYCLSKWHRHRWRPYAADVVSDLESRERIY